MFFPHSGVKYNTEKHEGNAMTPLIKFFTKCFLGYKV